jgi:hypothetical protein
VQVVQVEMTPEDHPVWIQHFLPLHLQAVAVALATAADRLQLLAVLAAADIRVLVQAVQQIKVELVVQALEIHLMQAAVVVELQRSV